MKHKNKFNRNHQIEKTISCSCGAIAKLKTRRNYPHGKKSKVIKSQNYECKKCGKIKLMIKEQKGGRK